MHRMVYFERYCKILQKIVLDVTEESVSLFDFQIVVIAITFTALGFGINGVVNIRMDYDPVWFMDQKSYQTHYYKKLHDAFPEQGERVEIYLGK